MLTEFNRLTTKIDVDLSTLSNEELQELYDDCYTTKDYYNFLQLVVKLLANAVYGAAGSEFFRFFNVNVATDITQEGKMFMFLVEDVINTYFHTWETDKEMEELLRSEFPNHDIRLSNTKQFDISSYGDTDSRYISFGHIFAAANFKPHNPDEVIKFILLCDKHRISTIIEEGLHDKILSMNGDLGWLEMELEVIGGKAIFLQKKKYVMSLFWKDGKSIYKNGKMKATGVELQQSQTSIFVKDSIKVIIKKLLTPGSKMQDIFRLGSMIVERARTAPPDALVKVTGISDYNGWVKEDRTSIQWHKTLSIPIQVKAAANYNNYIYKTGLSEKLPRYIPGQKIKWYYTTDKTFFGGVFGVPDGIDIRDVEGAPEIDYNVQVDKIIIAPLKRYLFTDEIDKTTFGEKEMLVSFKSI